MSKTALCGLPPSCRRTVALGRSRPKVVNESLSDTDGDVAAEMLRDATDHLGTAYRDDYGVALIIAPGERGS